MLRILKTGVLSVILMGAMTASALAAKAATPPTQADIQSQICAQMQTNINRETSKKKPNQSIVTLLQQQYDAYCPALAVVTISADGCTVTAQGPVGALITYGAATPDGGRGYDAEPVTITDAKATFTGYTGAANGLNVYVTVSQNGKTLATKSAPVTTTQCTAGLPNGGYPDKFANAPQDSLIDPWGMYNRESVSYTAFKVYQSRGYMPAWGFEGRGNANQWDDNARAAGIPVDTTPRAGDVAIWNRGMYGQSFYVEAVHADGSLDLSTYNYDNTGRYSLMTNVRLPDLVFIHF